MDRVRAAWQGLQTFNNHVTPVTLQSIHLMTKALNDVPGSLNDPGGGGNNGGGNTGNHDADAVIAQAQHKLGAKYKLGAEGPTVFDCSGLVYWCFTQAGHGALISGHRLLAAGYAHWFAGQGHYTRDLSQRARGDLIVYAHDGQRISHIALYLGGDRIISALINPWGVKNTGFRHISLPPVGVCKVQYSGASTAFRAEQAQGPADNPDAQDVFLADDTDDTAGVTAE